MQKFCPSATEDRTRCEAEKWQYKCGVFFLDLPNREKLSWIGALPDIFKKRVSFFSLAIQSVKKEWTLTKVAVGKLRECNQNSWTMIVVP